MASSQEKLTLVIEAENNAKQAIESVNKSIESVNTTIESNKQKLQDAGKVAGVIFAGMSAIVLKTVSDYGEAEAAAAQLRHAVIDVSHATEQQLAATSALSDALERKGVLDGDNIKTGLAQLSTFGLSNDAVQKLGGSLADLAVNQFGVNASGEQLSQTANMIAKALNGQFGVLEKSGIRFTEAQQAIIKTGTEMEKVRAINEGFAQNLKYTNEVALTTFEGKLAASRVQLGNMSEAIGQALLPAILKILEVVTPVIEKFASWAQENPRLSAAIIGATLALSGLLVALASFVTIAPAVGAAFTIMTGPIGIVIALLGVIVATFWYVGQNLDGVIAMMKELWNGFVAYLEASPLMVYFQAIVSAASALALAMETALIFIQEKWTVFSEQLTAIMSIIQNKWIEWTLFLQQRFEFFISVLKTLWDTFKAAFDGVMKAVGDVWDKTWEGAKNTIVAVWESIKSTIKAGIDWIDQQIARITAAFASARAMVGGVGSTISSGVSTVSSTVASLFRASGGPVNPQSPFIVGENGPELFTPQGYGSIARAGTFGTQPISIVFQGNTFMGKEGIAEEIGDKIIDMVKQNLKLS